jgi:hypothetical protein
MFGALGMCLVTGHAVAQSNLRLSSLCDLQAKVAQGEHRTVRVEGVYSAGLESQQLVAPTCSSQSTAVEFELKSTGLKKKLWQLSNQSNQVRVTFEGEFFGPPVPDPKLPEAILKQYHPGWDYNSKTKLVVYTILSVKAVPADTPKKPH